MQNNEDDNHNNDLSKHKIWLPDSYIHTIEEKKARLTPTDFLEKHKIWFTTVLSFALTLAAIMISTASFNVSRYQAQLNEQSINDLDSEKQPYFSVENLYVDSESEYTYLIKNTGGDVRYNNILLSPYLYIERRKDGKLEPLNYAFIELNGLYRLSDYQLTENILFAFKDYMFSDEITNESVLANELFLNYSCWDNLGGMNTSIYSQIIYKLQVSYVNYKNEYKVDVITFSRISDVNDKVGGNTILTIDKSGRFLMNSNSTIYKVDSLNLPKESIRKQCEDIISTLRKDFGQLDAAEKYRNENKNY